tara:strand:- start:171 stop:410 length:240 start_codon:yes stop_codon:yes gene_type:complete
MDTKELIKARNEIDTEMIELSKKIRELEKVKSDYEYELWNKCEHIWVNEDDGGNVGWTPKVCSKCRLSSVEPRKKNYLR